MGDRYFLSIYFKDDFIEFNVFFGTIFTKEPEKILPKKNFSPSVIYNTLFHILYNHVIFLWIGSNIFKKQTSLQLDYKGENYS